MVRRTPAGWTVGGSVVMRLKEGTAIIAYVIETDAGWRTSRVSVSQLLKGRRSVLEMRVVEGRWTVNGREARRLRGCADVDLLVSPATNTLPIKRSGLNVGKRVDVASAWVKFPSLRVSPLRQSYERLGKRRYRYRSATGFEADLLVDGFGLVRRYANWAAIDGATSPS